MAQPARLRRLPAAPAAAGRRRWARLELPLVRAAAPPSGRPTDRPTSRSQQPLRQAASSFSLRARAGGAGGARERRAALEPAEAEAAVRPEAAEDDEDEEEALPHSEAVDVFQEGLAMVVQDPLLCDLPIQVTLEEVNSQIALEYGQAMTVRVCKMDGEIMPVVVVQNATVLDLKKAIQRYVQLRQEREGGIQHISWSYVWRTYYLISAGEKLTEDRKKLRDYGIRNRDEVSFIKKLRQK
uniref:U11/U12 small nuclear ribonucleoprotein 25 kDa protein n=2 Tax=Otariidae TaxID=9702 RepID=A0A3Q7PJE5_CALUR|nr:U11/U12 small nuclear ribonucleoprotein 25 kDa protein [Callorhinus ursinus]